MSIEQERETAVTIHSSSTSSSDPAYVRRRERTYLKTASAQIWRKGRTITVYQ
jgi:hypothetical protein